jgi:hypothetical protein
MSRQGTVSGTPVVVDDVTPPRSPVSPVEALTAYLQGGYAGRRSELMVQLDSCRALRNKEDVIQLGYDALLFRFELDAWLAFAGQLLDEERGRQFDLAHAERLSEAQEDGRKRADATLVKCQAEQFIAPLKRAHKELADTQALLGQIVSWCQSQQKILAAEEYGDLFSANNEAPEQGREVSFPPEARIGGATR